MGEDITEEQAQDLIRSLGQDKQTVHKFLDNVAKAEDSSKTSNLTLEELGTPQLPVRTYSELAIFCKDIADEEDWADYFGAIKQSNLATGLSKEGFLINAAITLKRMSADVNAVSKENKGWFKKKEPTDGQPPIQTM